VDAWSRACQERRSAVVISRHVLAGGLGLDITVIHAHDGTGHAGVLRSASSAATGV
jgi:hypothetical protein